MKKADRALLIALLLLSFGSARAQDDELPETDDVRNHPWQVFMTAGEGPGGADVLTFVDTLTGEQETLNLIGERYTPHQRSVLYFDLTRARVMLARPDGATREHPFIQPAPESRRVDWAISHDQTRIAWTLTNLDGGGRLTTVTTVASIDGSDPRTVLLPGEREDLLAGPRTDELRALPLGFSLDGSTLFMDMHPDGLDSRLPVAQYAGLFSIDIATGAVSFLPGEADYSCLCGAGLGAGFYLRLAPDGTLRVYNLLAGVSETLAPPRVPGLSTNALPYYGDVVISPDGTRAVYALALVSGLGTAQQNVQTALFAVDLGGLSQRLLTSPIDGLVRPVAWTEENTAVLLTSPNRDGTWKVALADGRLDRIANATYIGTLQPLGEG